MARTELAIAEFRALIDDLWQPPGEDAPARAKTNHTNRVEVLTDLYRVNTTRLVNTAYAAERAITEYADWRTAIRPTGSLLGNNLAARATPSSRAAPTT